MTQLRLYRPEALARAEEELFLLGRTKALAATAKTAKQQRNCALTRIATDAATATATASTATTSSAEIATTSSTSLNTFTFNFM